MDPVLLAVDLSYQTYRASAANARLKSAEGEFTGGLYGFLTSLGSAINEVKASHVVICQDCKPYKRSLLYPEYKQLRAKAKDEELYERFQFSLPLVLEACETIGLPVLGIPGYESDDCIAALVEQERCWFDTVYAMANDSDLFQLFYSPKFRCYKTKGDEFDAARLWKEWAIRPEELVLLLALTGTHNDVAGIEGIGPVKAAKILRDPAKLRACRERHGAMIERNMKLIALPYEGFPNLGGIPRTTRQFKARDFYKFLARFDIQATGPMVDAFTRVCP